jgi:two-component system, LytTR family, sensor kinase
LYRPAVRVRPALFVSAAWIVPAILGALNELVQYRLEGGAGLSARAMLYGAADWLLFAAFTPFVFLVSRRWPLVRGRLALHVALHILAGLLFSFLWAGGGTLLKAALVPHGLWGTVGQHFLRWLFVTLPVGVSVYLGLVGTEHGLRYFVRTTQLSEQLSVARLAALQASVNPHFLFNTLNTIAVLVRDGERAAATRIIEQFSDVMRHALRRGTHEVTLEQELTLVRQYVAIEEARFSDRLRPHFDVDPSLLHAAVPTFALQHLVENAIRHGVARHPDAGEVSIRARRDGEVLDLSVADDGPGVEGDPAVDVAPHGEGHGLANTRERLAGLYGNAASLLVTRRSPRGTLAVLRIPLRELPPELPHRVDE